MTVSKILAFTVVTLLECFKILLGSNLLIFLVLFYWYRDFDWREIFTRGHQSVSDHVHQWGEVVLEQATTAWGPPACLNKGKEG